MSLVEIYGPHIPYLRRFARALTGTQAAGDSYVRTTLEILSAKNESADSDIPPQTELFRELLNAWNATGPAQTANDSAPNPEGHFQRLTPLPRQAFLLQSLEGFSVDKIAIVLNKSTVQVKQLIADAEAEIEQNLRTNVLIIEDEPFIAAELEGLVTTHGHTVDGIAATHTKAVEMARIKKPGLILSDVHLADGSSGFEAVKEILDTLSVPVVFITAFPELLLTGDKTEPAYLISKPFKPGNVKAAISQALFFHDANLEG